MLSVEECMYLVLCAQLRCQLIALILHSVQLDAEHPAQLLVCRCICLVESRRVRGHDTQAISRDNKERRFIGCKSVNLKLVVSFSDFQALKYTEDVRKWC